MKHPDELSGRTLTLKRTFSAPIKLVWEAWSEPGHISQWWGPKGMTTKVIEHNFEVDGNWKYTMDMPNGSEFITEGQFIEIIEFEKICSTANFRPMTEGVEIQALFQSEGDKTNFTFNVIHPTEKYCKQQEDMGSMNGWGSVFDRLDLFVNAQNNK